MRWIRVVIPDTDKLVIPNVCPNCLSTPAETPVVIHRTFAVPLGSVRWTAQWPFCPRCATWITRHTPWKRWFAMAPAALLAGLSIVIAVKTSDHGVHASAYWLLLAAAIVAATGGLIATFIQWRAPKPANCLSNFPTVQPISSRTFDFAHPIYVEHLIAANESGALKVNYKSLDKAKAAFERRNA